MNRKAKQPKRKDDGRLRATKYERAKRFRKPGDRVWGEVR